MKFESKSSGHFRLERLKVDCDNNVIESTCEKLADFTNLITDIGLVRMGTNADYLNFCRIGSGSATPVFADEQLGAQLASVGSPVKVNKTKSTEPYYAYSERTFTFGVGVAAGNISEVGIGWEAGGPTLFSRSLIKDELGNPITLTILSDEVLRVVYEHRYYPPLTDVTGTFTLTGNLGGEYSYVARAANAGNNSYWSAHLSQSSSGTGSGLSWYLHNGTISSSITGSPSGTSLSGAQNAVVSSASGNSASFSYPLGLTIGNLTGGISAMVAHLGNGRFQFQFTPPIPKTADDLLSLNFTHTWGRV